MSSRLEPPTHTTGAHRARRRAPRPATRQQPMSYEPYLDGLFTYCLSAIHDHQAATALLGDVLAIAARHHARAPDDESGRKAWLYAVARWACRRRLAEERQFRAPAHARRAHASPRGTPPPLPQRQAAARRPSPGPPPAARAGAPGEPGTAPGTPTAPPLSSAPASSGPPGAPGAWTPASPGPGPAPTRAAGWAPQPSPASRFVPPGRAVPAALFQPAADPAHHTDHTDPANHVHRAGYADHVYRRERAVSRSSPMEVPNPWQGRAPRASRVRLRRVRGAWDAPPGEADGGGDPARHAELALLAWPEAAGTSPEQREALELAVRHGLTPREVAAVLGLAPVAARELLAAGACEVERTRAALAVVESGGCPSVARLTGDHRVLLSAALRTELVRHVDDCPRCRGAAERAEAEGPWPGSDVTPARLPLIAADRAAARHATRAASRARAAAPRFGRGGFPLDPKDDAARRDRLRARAVTTTVVATVVAAPVLALWAAYRSAPLTGEGHRGGASVTASEAGGGRGQGPYDRYESAGNTKPEPGPRFAAGQRADGVSVEVAGARPGVAPPVRGGLGPGRLTVSAQPSGDSTLITLSASGRTPVTWSLWSDARWLTVSRSSGVLHPGESITLRVAIDRDREPVGPWRARLGIDPSGAVVTIEGRGARRPARPPAGPAPAPTDPPPAATPTPTASASPTPAPTPTASAEPPVPTPSASPSSP
ncbi:hypothetical protein ACFVIM_02100 [Streptomyces sp. NPDC057638]|uniref:BACON domain-containing protein n=1 Tax=Streptomyces sp. NPDC057638 TaxID=3346190 RepID=UPI00368AD2F4